MNDIPPVTYEISPDVNCIKCDALNPTLLDRCTVCDQMLWNMDIGEFFNRLFQRQLADARQGGLILGRNGPEDDIPLFDMRAKNVASLIGLMQGMEFIASTEATAKHYERLEQINTDKGDAEELNAIHLPMTGNVIDTNQFKPIDDIYPYAGLWVTQQFIINRYATKKHFEELVHLNTP